MFMRFYTGEDARENATIFAQKVLAFNKNVSPAQIQGYFMIHKLSTQEEVLQNVETIWDN